MPRGTVLKGRVRRSHVKTKRRRHEWREQLRALNWRRKRTTELLSSWREAPADKKPSLLKLYRLSRGLAAKSRAKAVEEGAEYRKARTTLHIREKALRAFRRALRNPYPHLSGDLDALPRVLQKLESLARDIGRNIFVTSGTRWPAEQLVLWNNRHSNPFPVAFCCPCQSNHCPRDGESKGRASDCLIGGVPIQHVVSSSKLREHGLEPLIGDAVHVEG